MAFERRQCSHLGRSRVVSWGPDNDPIRSNWSSSIPGVMNTERLATCACEKLQIRVKGDPSIVAACSCLQCQKRTGSVFGAVAFFEDDRVIEITGNQRCFERSSDSGRRIQIHFCPNCGSSVYWKTEFLKDSTGIAVGCFADPDFPRPQSVAWTATKHSWLQFPEDCRFSASQKF